jgi:cytochrome c553
MLNHTISHVKSKVIYLLLLFWFLLHLPIFANKDSIYIIAHKTNTIYSSHDIRLGERIFHGQVSTAATVINCASCHNVDRIDTFNWNPSAYDLALKYANKDFETFKSVITNPTGNVMSAIHGNLQLDDQQIQELKAYLNELAKKGMEPKKPLLTNRIIFIFMLLLFIIAIIDLAYTKKIKYLLVHTLVIIGALGLMGNFIVNSAISLGRSQNYKPDQPIKFSHKVHAGQNKTNCLYCHFNAEQSKFAGIPPLSVCMNCHTLVREGSRSGKFEINKIYSALENNMAIKWVKVHNLPDHVFFSHAQHIKAGKIDCNICHGDVAKMNEIVQVSDLSMGWCVKCHRETGVQFDNKFYEKYEQLHKDLKEGKIKQVTVDKIGGTDCMKCHY